MYSSHYKRPQVASLWMRSWLWTPPALRKHGCRAPLQHCGSGEGGPRRDARRSFAGSSSVAWHCGENKPGTWQFRTESISGPLKCSSVGSTTITIQQLVHDIMCVNASCEGLPSPACLHCHWPPWSHSSRRRRPPYGMVSMH